MSLVQPPTKPFQSYKWRWAVLTPTESLNDPPVFLGVLRVFNEFQNFAPSSKEIMNALRIVQHETSSDVDLVRTQERNLIRNSGQYWKALGLLYEARGKVLISPFGQLLAEGKITQVEFATTIIKTLELPNKNIVADTSEWDAVGLKIKPLELILNILALMAQKFGLATAYVTPYELLRIIIPLAGVKASLDTLTGAIDQTDRAKSTCLIGLFVRLALMTKEWLENFYFSYQTMASVKDALLITEMKTNSTL